jgi:hypothetical protein
VATRPTTGLDLGQSTRTLTLGGLPVPHSDAGERQLLRVAGERADGLEFLQRRHAAPTIELEPRSESSWMASCGGPRPA